MKRRASNTPRVRVLAVCQPKGTRLLLTRRRRIEMTKLGNTIAMAFDDAARAEALVASGQARRALRDDPERMLRMFAFHGREIESAGVRTSRIERRDLAVRAMSRLHQPGAAV